MFKDFIQATQISVLVFHGFVFDFLKLFDFSLKLYIFISLMFSFATSLHYHFGLIHSFHMCQIRQMFSFVSSVHYLGLPLFLVSPGCLFTIPILLSSIRFICAKYCSIQLHLLQVRGTIHLSLR